ncbi:MAG: RNA recognition motif domain-containing protein [Arenicellales bacterium]
MKLLIRNLARTTTEAELRKMFEVLGPVQSCKLVMDKQTGKSKGFAFIEMPRPGDAKAAVKTLNGKDVAGNIIRVKKASPKKSLAEEASPDKTQPEKDEVAKILEKAIEPEKPEPEKPEPKKNSATNHDIWSSND